MDAAPGRNRVLAQKRLSKSDTLVAQHIIKQCHHSVLYLLRCENSEAAGCVVDAKARVWQTIQGALVMFSLKSKVSLDHNDDFAKSKLANFAKTHHVALHKSKLLLRFCKRQAYVRVLNRIEATGIQLKNKNKKTK